MTSVIIYATNSGATQEAAELVTEEFKKSGIDTTLVHARDVDIASLSNYDVIVFGSCTWEQITPKKRFEGSLQEHFLTLRDTLKKSSFPNKKFAVFGLGDSSYTNFCIAANHLEALVKQLKGTQVGDTLRVDKYYFNLNENRSKVRSWARTITKALA